MISHKNHIKKILTVIFIALLFCIALFVIYKTENKKTDFDETNDTVYHETVSEPVRYNGKWYTENSALQNIVIIGLDKYEDTKVDGNYINNQQADFIAVLSVDSSNKTVKSLQINRDTMADVKILGVGGKEAGENIMQIALSHTYGSGGSDSCLNTVKSVSELLYGIKIHHYIALTMDTIPSITDAFDGVKVTLDYDLTELDPFWTEGSEITLTGDNALSFVRARSELSDSSNISRMGRQKKFITSLVNKAKAQYQSEGNKVLYKLLTDINGSITSDFSIYQLQDLCDSVATFEFSEIYQIEGESKKGEEYIEFYPDEEILKEKIIERFFTETTVE